MSHHLILRVVAKLLIPFILLFGLYVQFHGDYGPGGGFQAGVIFAAAFVLHALVFGVEAARRIAPARLLEAGIAGGVLLFAGTGLAGLLMGGHFLDYDVLFADPLEGQHHGILLVELGVGITVAAVMIAVFLAFAGRKEDP
ncbi:MAG: Na(+)/H(+) antiporter subunit B [Gemmatimonadaceae bacterium]|nr:Na(+)/H(+) antiporter subunit B [Gemmatimonadaceae bacterium]